MNTEKLDQVVEELKAIVGEENVITDPALLYCYSTDASINQHMPDVVVRPGKTEEVSEILKLANRERIPVHPRGGGTSLSGSVVPYGGGIVVDMTRMNKIIDIRPADLWCIVEAGVIHADLERELAKYGLFYPPDPASSESATIGGTIATNAGGLRGVKYGTTRDWVLGLEVVLPTGDVINVGTKTLKTSSGYQLCRLFVGSEGTLGIITKAVLKLLPIPKARVRVMGVFDSVVDAARAVSQIFMAGITPGLLEFVDKNAQKAINSWLNLGLPETEAILIIDLEGSTEEEPLKLAPYLERVLKENGAIEARYTSDPEEMNKLYLARAKAYPAMFRLGKPTVLVEDITVPVEKLPEAVKKVYEITEKHGILMGIIGHIGDGNFHPLLVYDERDPEEVERVMKCHDEINELAIKLGGTVTGEHAVGKVKAKYFLKEHSPEEIELMRGIKRVFDPNGIMNPGILWGE